MLGEKRSQAMFGQGTQMAASGTGQEREAGYPGPAEKEMDVQETGILREMAGTEGTTGKENSDPPVIPSTSRIPTATVGVTNAQVHAAPMEPPAVADVEEEEEAVQFQQGGTALRTHDLFFSPQDSARDFSSVLKEVQEYISSKYSTLIMEEGGEETKAQIKRYITKYVQDYRIAVKGMSGQELVDTIYTEMAEFSFLTRYVFGPGIEEIDINSWQDIAVQYAGGET